MADVCTIWWPKSAGGWLSNLMWDKHSLLWDMLDFTNTTLTCSGTLVLWIDLKKLKYYCTRMRDFYYTTLKKVLPFKNIPLIFALTWRLRSTLFKDNAFVVQFLRSQLLILYVSLCTLFLTIYSSAGQMQVNCGQNTKKPIPFVLREAWRILLVENWQINNMPSILVIMFPWNYWRNQILSNFTFFCNLKRKQCSLVHGW